MLITKELIISISNNQKTRYLNLGYEIINGKSTIKIEDLPKFSRHKIEAQCDLCFRQLKISYHLYTKCVSQIEIYTCQNCKEEKKKLTNLQKFGHEYASKNPEIKNKIKQNNLKKYGHICPLHNPEISKKVRTTNLERYGSEYSSKNEEVKNKIKTTNLERYGSESPLSNIKIKEKIKKTNIEKYGFENVSKNKDIIKKRVDSFKRSDKKSNVYDALKIKFQDPDFVKNRLEKTKNSNIEKFGVDHYSKTNEYKESVKNTLMSRYGTVSFNALPDIKLKANKTRNGNLIEKYNSMIGSKYSILSLENGIFEIQNESDIFKIHINHLRDRIYLKTEISTNKNPLYFGNTSGYENQISEFLSSLDIDFITSSKNIISPQQIDIFIPSHKLGIEFNGIYWHSELFKSKKYHLNKTNECIKKGINLIHIFEDDWILKNDIVKSIIRNKLNKTENRIFARNCKIEEIDTKAAKLFLEENHIQGFSSSSIKVGLFYKSELVSIMTFGNKYIKKIKEFELSRFCSKINTVVIGGAEKLFSYVLKKYNPLKIISYSDLSIFGGSLYEKIGFKFNKLSKPNYYWVVNGQRYHRFTFNKKKLIRDGHDASKSETEIMHSLGHYRIWGCGQKSWIYENY